MDRRRATGFVLVAISAAGFGSGTVLSKPIYAAGLDWLQLLAWRFAIGAALAWGWILISSRRRAAIRRLGRRPAASAAGLGVWYSGNAGTYYAGLETVPASLAGVLVYLYPAVVAVLSVRYATRLTGRRPWAALGIALVGVVLALGGIQLDPPPPAGGILLILASPLIYAGWIVLSARLAGERSDQLAHESDVDGRADDASAATALMIGATAAVFIVGALLTGRPLAPDRMPSAAWPYLAAIGFASTFLAIQTFYAGARRIGAAQAALVSTIEPLIIVTLATFALHEVLAPVQLGGAALILLGVIVAQTGPRPAGAPEPASPLDSAVAPAGRD
ncbi:MAG TPA: DMT family transporter [Candidatus Limnocylindrales bacterium]|nr:DMT family transporter [Candidatus Limnocylindrales bacterium]